MLFTEIYEIIFRCLLIIIGIFYMFKKQFKIMLSLIFIFALSYLSFFIKKFFSINIDTLSNFIYLIIIFNSIYLGGSLKYYDKYKNWDRSIHALSGISFVGFGIAIIRITPSIKLIIVLLFGFTFSITIHVIWEVLEYISDCLFQSNAQRWQLHHNSINHKPSKSLQPAGLVDTMNDSICCIIGSALATVVWGLLL
jgi:hypothetical protein